MGEFVGNQLRAQRRGPPGSVAGTGAMSPQPPAGPRQRPAGVGGDRRRKSTTILGAGTRPRY